jgi:hypothetical protein
MSKRGRIDEKKAIISNMVFPYRIVVGFIFNYAITIVD